jgi:hypothetical protein
VSVRIYDGHRQEVQDYKWQRRRRVTWRSWRLSNIREEKTFTCKDESGSPRPLPGGNREGKAVKSLFAPANSAGDITGRLFKFQPTKKEQNNNKTKQNRRTRRNGRNTLLGLLRAWNSGWRTGLAGVKIDGAAARSLETQTGVDFLGLLPKLAACRSFLPTDLFNFFWLYRTGVY